LFGNKIFQFFFLVPGPGQCPKKATAKESVCRDGTIFLFLRNLLRKTRGKPPYFAPVKLLQRIPPPNSL